MALYFKDIEITNIDNLVPQTGLDITDIWFGSTNIYTVWQTYEGTLPATINANGDNLRQYQIWGNVGGVGKPTENMYNKNNASMNFEGYVNNTTYTVTASTLGSLSIIVPVEPNTTYTIVKPATSRFRIGTFTSYPYPGKVATAIFGDRNGGGIDYGTSLTFTTSNNTSYILAFIRNYTDAQVTNEQMKNSTMVLEGSTPPASFVLFGYEVDMVTGSNILQSSEIEQGGWYAAAGVAPEKIVNFARCRSKNIYTISSKKIFYDFKSLNVNTAFIDSNGLSLGGSGFKSGVGSVDVPANAVKCLFIIANTDTSTNILPAQVIAAEIWASVDTTITPIYIGDEPLWAVNNYADYTDYQKQKIVRAIKKYVLTGEESWEEITGAFASRTYFRWVFGTLNYCVRHVCTCSHFTQTNITTATTTVGFDVFDSTSVNGEVLAIRPSGVQSTTLEDFKAWLAEQYAAGTPVTVWCALTVAEEADPPVPLPEIPTLNGTTVLDYDGTPTPSKVELKYKKGW